MRLEDLHISLLGFLSEFSYISLVYLFVFPNGIISVFLMFRFVSRIREHRVPCMVEEIPDAASAAGNC